jgi:hypothetical protein
MIPTPTLVSRVCVPNLCEFEQWVFCTSIRIAAWLFPWQTASAITGWRSRVAVPLRLYPWRATGTARRSRYIQTAAR